MIGLRPILLVEDNPKGLELTLEALDRIQLANEVVTARDGVEALDWLFRRNGHESRETSDPAFILLDLKLPRVDGLQVLAQIKGDEGLRHLPVVMLTASREERDLVKSYKLGVNAFVVKPVGFQEFFDAVREVGVFWAVINEPVPSPPRSGPMKITEA